MNFLTTPVLYGLAAAAVIGWASAGVQTVRVSLEKVETAKVRSDWDKDKTRQAIAAREAIEAQKIEAEEFAEKQAEVLNEGIEQYKAMADNERAARLASERLRRAESAPRGGASQQGSAASATSQSASSPADLSAYVSRRLDEATDGIAIHADDTFIRSDACERFYEALRPSK